jgi:hypothetical protein
MYLIISFCLSAAFYLSSWCVILVYLFIVMFQSILTFFYCDFFFQSILTYYIPSMQIKSIISTSSILQIRKHNKYFEHFNFVIFVDFNIFICILPLCYSVMCNMNLFTNLSFLVLVIFKFVLLLIDISYQFDVL